VKDLLTKEERETVEFARAGQGMLSGRLLQALDRLAPKPQPKTDQDLAEMLETALGGNYAFVPTMRAVRDALRARGAK